MTMTMTVVVIVGVCIAARLLVLFVRAVRRENRRQNAILNRFDRDRPVREPGLRTPHTPRAAGE